MKRQNKGMMKLLNKLIKTKRKKLRNKSGRNSGMVQRIKRRRIDNLQSDETKYATDAGPMSMSDFVKWLRCNSDFSGENLAEE